MYYRKCLEHYSISVAAESIDNVAQTGRNKFIRYNNNQKLRCFLTLLFPNHTQMHDRFSSFGHVFCTDPF